MQQSSFAKKGLAGLNQTMLRSSGEKIKQVLDIAELPESYPMLVHCTAGKDRTGLVIAILQLIAGVPSQLIVSQY